ncbi:TolC family protein [Chryseobacterium indoltheticum]|uniref:TolC family protein n=1 Tax=Chryseobacterium indoltheticum TaxID=254 RepID=UPI003F499AAD
MKKVLTVVLGLAFAGLNAQQKWSLRECVDYAVKHNLQVIQNEYSKQIQDSNLKIAQRNYLPSVNASMGNNVSFGQASLGTTSIRNDQFSNSSNIGADILIYNNGRLEKTIRKSQFDVEASQYDIEAIKNDISLQIAQQYLTTLLNKEIVKISQSAVDNAKKQFDRAKITTEVGTTAQTDCCRSRSSLGERKTKLKNCGNKCRKKLICFGTIASVKRIQRF